VVGAEGEVGRVIDVRTHPTADTAVIQLSDGRVAEQALDGHWVTRIDVEEKLMELSSMEGLLV
jgi:hypothetical protein